MRELGHEFVARDVSDDQLDALSVELRKQLERVRDAAPRVRELSRDRLEEFSLTIPTYNEIGQRQLFSDSVVAGAANPMGLGAQLWRDGDVACMRVTLGKAFEGAPGRAHGGVVAALLDESLLLPAPPYVNYSMSAVWFILIFWIFYRWKPAWPEWSLVVSLLATFCMGWFFSSVITRQFGVFANVTYPTILEIIGLYLARRIEMLLEHRKKSVGATGR